VVVVLDDSVVVVVLLLLLGYVECSEGCAGGGLVCAMTIPAVISAATPKDVASRFIGASVHFAGAAEHGLAYPGKESRPSLLSA